MALSIKESLELYMTQYEFVDGLWTYFSTVTLAVLGFTIGSDRATKKPIELRVILIGYFIFSIGNLIALLYAQNDLRMFANYVIKVGSEFPKDFTFSPFPLWTVALFHLLIVISVLIGISSIYKSRHPEDKE